MDIDKKKTKIQNRNKSDIMQQVIKKKFYNLTKNNIKNITHTYYEKKQTSHLKSN